MLGPTLIGHQVIQERETIQKSLLVPFGVVEALHHEQLPLDGVVGLIQERAGHGHTRICKHRIPPCFLVPAPVPDACAIRRSPCGGHMVRKAPQSLAEGKHPQAPPPLRLVQEDMELGAQGLTDRRRNRRQFPGELDKRMAEAMAETGPWKQRPYALAGAIKAIDEPCDPQ